MQRSIQRSIGALFVREPLLFHRATARYYTVRARKRAMVDTFCLAERSNALEISSIGLGIARDQTAFAFGGQTPTLPIALRNRAMALHDVDHRPPTEADGMKNSLYINGD